MKKKDKFYYLLLLLFIFIAIVTVVKGYIDRKEVREIPRYTICTTIKASRTAKSGLMVDVYYKVNGKEYKTWGHYIDGVKYPNGKYFLMCSAQNPEKSIVLFDKPVTKNIKNAPINGWEKMPY